MINTSGWYRSYTIGFGVSNDLPLFDRNQGQIVLQSKQALFAPPATLLPTDEGYRLSTRQEGRFSQ